MPKLYTPTGPLTPQDRADIKRVLGLYGRAKNWAVVFDTEIKPPTPQCVFLPLTDAAKPARELLRRIGDKL